MDSSEIAAVEPAPVQRRVLSTFADVPLNAGRLVVGQIASTARQQHQRRPNELSFDDVEHAKAKLPLGAFPVDTKAPNWSASEPHYCRTAHATKATVAIPPMINKLTTSARSSFSRGTNSSLPHRAML